MRRHLGHLALAAALGGACGTTPGRGIEGGNTWNDAGNHDAALDTYEVSPDDVAIDTFVSVDTTLADTEIGIDSDTDFEDVSDTNDEELTDTVEEVIEDTSEDSFDIEVDVDHDDLCNGTTVELGEYRRDRTLPAEVYNVDVLNFDFAGIQGSGRVLVGLNFGLYDTNEEVYPPRFTEGVLSGARLFDGEGNELAEGEIDYFSNQILFEDLDLSDSRLDNLSLTIDTALDHEGERFKIVLDEYTVVYEEAGEVCLVSTDISSSSVFMGDEIGGHALSFPLEQEVDPNILLSRGHEFLFTYNVIAELTDIELTRVLISTHGDLSALNNIRSFEFEVDGMSIAIDEGHRVENGIEITLATVLPEGSNFIDIYVDTYTYGLDSVAQVFVAEDLYMELLEVEDSRRGEVAATYSESTVFEPTTFTPVLLAGFENVPESSSTSVDVRYTLDMGDFSFTNLEHSNVYRGTVEPLPALVEAIMIRIEECIEGSITNFYLNSSDGSMSFGYPFTSETGEHLIRFDSLGTSLAPGREITYTFSAQNTRPENDCLAWEVVEIEYEAADASIELSAFLDLGSVEIGNTSGI